jgi:hypothetical protein
MGKSLDGRYTEIAGVGSYIGLKENGLFLGSPMNI